jgi:hypothetical protein
MSKPVLGSCEHDSHVLWGPRSSEGDQSWPEPPPPATGVVDSAIELFAHILPLQDAVACHRMIAQLIESVRSPKLERNPARKAAVFINATSALLLSLRLTATRFRQAQQTLGSPQCAAALADFLKVRVNNSLTSPLLSSSLVPTRMQYWTVMKNCDPLEAKL